MKKNHLKKLLATVLALVMVITMLPSTALAAEKVTSNPGGATLDVEYFNSTLYNWDEGKANEATRTADVNNSDVSSGNPTIAEIQSGQYYLDLELTQQVTVKSEVTGNGFTYTEHPCRYSDVISNNDTRRKTDYFYTLDGENYYPVYATRTRSGKNIQYTFEYMKDDGTYEKFVENESDDSFTLYTRSGSETRNYWLESNGQKVEGDTTYDSISKNVISTLYWPGTSGQQAGKGFYFTNSGNKPADSDIPSFSKWSGKEQNYHIYSGIVEKKLSDSTNVPFNNANVNAANLFATDGSNSDYTDVYQNVRVPFVYDEVTGYYELNSDKNAVYFANGTAADNATMNIADKPVGFTNGSPQPYATGFQPFENVSDNERDAQNSANTFVPAYRLSQGDDSPTYGFGMVTQVPFQMTDNGKDAKGEDIQFEFSGDDDVWVYVDGVLALDIGGTHDAIRGVINFATGDVTLNAPGYANIGDKTACGSYVDQEENSVCGSGKDAPTLKQQNLYEALGTTLAGFAAQGQHTLTVYYMDRGQGKTNCLIKFNLPQKDSVSVTKQIDNTYSNVPEEIPADVMNTLNNVDFTFTLYKDGQSVSNKNYSLYDVNDNLIGTGSTDTSGQFRLKNGQTATFLNISLDDSQTWYVKEELPQGDRWTAGWEETSNVASATMVPGENAQTSDKVTVDGSTTSTDTISFNCTNSYSYVSGLDLDVNDETIVIDYGLPVEVDVLKNDVISGGEFENLEIKSTGLNHGTVEVIEDKIVYTLRQALNAVETITYSVTVRDTVNDEPLTKSGVLTIVPATSMYYEENFSNMITYSDATIKWESESDDNEYSTYQETDFSGTANDQAENIHTYGTDTIYLNNLGDSYGTSMHAVAVGAGAQFEYDFTGTGTAIYGRIAPTTGYIQVTVTNKETNEVTYRYIDTRVIGDVASSQTLYNIPIYNDDALHYGNYHVRVYLYKQGTPTNAGPSGAEFYLDGIRVYQPMGESVDDMVDGYETAQSAYASDGEANLALVNIRSKVLSDEEGALTKKSFITLTDINNNIVDIAEYNSIGPNEELYLTSGDYTVTFALVNWNTQAYKLYLGMKAPTGEKATVKIGTQTYELNNSADCYYDISKAVKVETNPDGLSLGYVTITCDEGLASLTNIKVTGTEEFVLVPGEDIEWSEEEETRILYMTSVDTAQRLQASVENDVEETFVPESIKLSCKYKKASKTTTVEAKVSKDVETVTINGNAAVVKTAGKNRFFTCTFENHSSNTTYEVICYNADGTASETYTVTSK